MRNVCVTGGAGFIGSNFVRMLLERESGVRIVTLDALTYAGNPDNLASLPDPARHHFVHGDICDRECVDRLLREHAIDTIVHFAAESHVDRSIAGPSAFVRTNVTGTGTLLDAARSFWIDEAAFSTGSVRFHHVSTDEVYGSLAPGEAAWSEETPYAPHSPYAATKASSDHLVRAWGRSYGLPFTITNCSNNYGPYQFPEKLIPLTILNALAGKPIPVYGDGRQVRDWIYVGDHCAAVHAVLTRGTPGETYHAGGGNQPENIGIVGAICDILDIMRPDSPHVPHRGLITHVEDRPGHDRRYALDTGKIERELGWRRTRSLKDGLRETVAWYLTNSEWTDALLERPSYVEWIERNYQGRSTK